MSGPGAVNVDDGVKLGVRDGVTDTFDVIDIVGDRVSINVTVPFLDAVNVDDAVSDGMYDGDIVRLGVHVDDGVTLAV